MFNPKIKKQPNSRVMPVPASCCSTSWPLRPRLSGRLRSQFDERPWGQRGYGPADPHSTPADRPSLHTCKDEISIHRGEILIQQHGVLQSNGQPPVFQVEENDLLETSMVARGSTTRMLKILFRKTFPTFSGSRRSECASGVVLQ